MDFAQIRQIALSAIAADDTLCDLLVLKGGNALELMHHVGDRGSLDLDFSMEGDFDSETLSSLLNRAVVDRFDAVGFVVFDTTFEFVPVPRSGTVPSWWGGYNFRFKFIPREVFKKYAGDLDALRRRATPIDTAHHKMIEIQISRFEYCTGSETKPVDGFNLRVYSLTMIACEKLRAICQQMPEYEMSAGASRAPRARDFYDICALLETGKVDLMSVDSIGILKAMFQAKRVALGLLVRIPAQREFHRQDWPRVINAVRAPIEEFDYYFDLVVGIVERFERAGIVQSP